MYIVDIWLSHLFFECKDDSNDELMVKSSVLVKPKIDISMMFTGCGIYIHDHIYIYGKWMNININDETRVE
jgi:hypothetical protein